MCEKECHGKTENKKQLDNYYYSIYLQNCSTVQCWCMIFLHALSFALCLLYNYYTEMLPIIFCIFTNCCTRINFVLTKVERNSFHSPSPCSKCGLYFRRYVISIILLLLLLLFNSVPGNGLSIQYRLQLSHKELYTTNRYVWRWIFLWICICDIYMKI